MESSLPRSDGSSISLQGVDTLGATASTHSRHTVQDWLASDHAAWSSMVPLDPARRYDTSAAANMKETCDEGFDASTIGQSGRRPTLSEPAAQQHDADAATQHAPEEAAERQSAVAALVQRFERCTVAKSDTQKRGSPVGWSALAFDGCSDNGSQRVARHLNTSFEPGSSPAELRVADGVSHRHAEPAALGGLAKLRTAHAAGADQTNAWEELSEEDDWLPHRYAWAVHQSHCPCATKYVQGSLFCQV